MWVWSARPAHDVVAGERDQHGVLDIVVERVAVADAFERDPRDRRHQLDEAAVGELEAPRHVVAEEVAERIRGKFRNRDHAAVPPE